MDRVLTVIPISEIRQRQVEILDGLQDGPTLLTQRGSAAAVLVSVEEWNQTAERLEKLADLIEDQEDVILVLKQMLADAKGEGEGWIEMSREELHRLIDEPVAA